MLFGNNNVVNPGVVALFAPFPIGTRLQVGVNAGNWVGELASLQNNVVVLTNAQLFGNGGAPTGGVQSIARIPLNLVTFVREEPERPRPPKPHKGKKAKKKVKECCKKFCKKACKVKKNVCECIEHFAKSVEKNIRSTEDFLNELFPADSQEPSQKKDEKSDNKNTENAQ